MGFVIVVVAIAASRRKPRVEPGPATVVSTVLDSDDDIVAWAQRVLVSDGSYDAVRTCGIELSGAQLDLVAVVRTYDGGVELGSLELKPRDAGAALTAEGLECVKRTLMSRHIAANPKLGTPVVPGGREYEVEVALTLPKPLMGYAQ